MRWSRPFVRLCTVWNRICPIVEPRFSDKNGSGMRAIRLAHRETVHSSYQEHQKTLIPSQWKYLPRTVYICAMDPFSEVDVFITAANFEDAFCQLPELMSFDFDARKLYARSLLKVPTSVNQPACSVPELR